MIIKLKQKPDGSILKREILKLGGDYSKFDKLRMAGTSSVRIIYISGIVAFDADDRGIEGEISFCSLQLLIDSLVLRFNTNQKISNYGIKNKNISELHFIQSKTNESKNEFDEIIGGTLAILLQDKTSIFFKIPYRKFDKTFKLFTKGKLVTRVNYSMEI